MEFEHSALVATMLSTFFISVGRIADLRILPSTSNRALALDHILHRPYMLTSIILVWPRGEVVQAHGRLARQERRHEERGAKKAVVQLLFLT